MARVLSFSAAIGELFEAYTGEALRAGLDAAFGSNGGFKSAKAKRAGGFSKSGFKTQLAFSNRVNKAEQALLFHTGTSRTKPEMEQLIVSIKTAAVFGAEQMVADLLAKLPDPDTNYHVVLGVAGGYNPQGDFIVEWREADGTQVRTLLELKYYEDLKSMISYYSALDATMFGSDHTMWKFLQTTAEGNPDLWNVFHQNKRYEDKEWLDLLNQRAWPGYLGSISRMVNHTDATSFYNYLKQKAGKAQGTKTIIRGFNATKSGTTTKNAIVLSMEAVMEALTEDAPLKTVWTQNRVRFIAQVYPPVPLMDFHTVPLGNPYNDFTKSSAEDNKQIRLATEIPKEYFLYAQQRL